MNRASGKYTLNLSLSLSLYIYIYIDTLHISCIFRIYSLLAYISQKPYSWDMHFMSHGGLSYVLKEFPPIPDQLWRNNKAGIHQGDHLGLHKNVPNRAQQMNGSNRARGPVGPIHLLGPNGPRALLEPFICWALLGPFIWGACRDHLNKYAYKSNYGNYV